MSTGTRNSTLNTQEAAAYLSVKLGRTEPPIDYSTVNRWAREGRIKVAWKMPGQTGARYFDIDELDRYADSLRVA